jgi:hypothetical protein
MRNKDIDVKFVAKLLFGKNLMLNIIKKDIGLNYGFAKITRLSNYANYLVTAILKLNQLKITGLKNNHASRKTIQILIT